MLRVALAFCAGAGAVQLLPVLPSLPLILLAGLAALAAWSRWHSVAVCLAGFACTSFGAQQLLAQDWPCDRDREEVTLTARVAAPAIVRDGRVDLDLVVLEPRGSGAPPRRLRLSWYEAPIVPWPGQVWRATARLRCRSGLVNPGGPDRELDLLRQRVFATGWLRNDPEPVLVGYQPWRHPVEWLRARVTADIARALEGGPSTGVLQGLAVGVRGSISTNLWDAFAATGLAHLIAISGLHVTAFALGVLALLRAAYRLPGCAAPRARLALETIVVLSATAGYALLAGASVPALRTLAMVAIVALQRLLRRAVTAPRTLALAAVLLVAADPLAIGSAGFWLSFTATWALLLLVEGGAGWRARVITFTRAQATLLVVLAPVLALAFGRLSLIAPVANAIAIPVFGFLLLPLTLAGTAVALVAPASADAIWHLLAGLLDRAWPWLIAAGREPWATWAPARQPLALVAVAGLGIAVALLLPLSGLRWAAAVLLLAVGLGRGPRPETGSWHLAVLDVGHGLATVVTTHRHALVFDTGPRWRGGATAARSALLPYLRAAGIRHLDRVIVSHGDVDHAGGADVLRAALPVADWLAGAGVLTLAPSSRCHQGQQWEWDGVQFRILHPPADFSGSDNDGSCVLAVSGIAGSALLLADPEAEAESLLADGPLAADVVLLPHHGSGTSSSPALVAAVRARLGIASTGFGNQWQLPRPAVVARWRAAGTTVVTTAAGGAVNVHFGARPGAIRATLARIDSPRWWQRRDAARYHAAACGRSSSPAARSCGRS